MDLFNGLFGNFFQDNCFFQKKENEIFSKAYQQYLDLLQEKGLLIEGEFEDITNKRALPKVIEYGKNKTT